MPLPQMTEEQRKAALEKAAETRRKRSEVREQLKSGELSAKEALDRRTDPIVGKIKVTQFIQSFPGYGKAKAVKIMEEIGIPENRRLAGLGDNQIAQLLEALQ